MTAPNIVDSFSMSSRRGAVKASFDSSSSSAVGYDVEYDVRFAFWRVFRHLQVVMQCSQVLWWYWSVVFLPLVALSDCDVGSSMTGNLQAIDGSVLTLSAKLRNFCTFKPGRLKLSALPTRLRTTPNTTESVMKRIVRSSSWLWVSHYCPIA